MSTEQRSHTEHLSPSSATVDPPDPTNVIASGAERAAGGRRRRGSAGDHERQMHMWFADAISWGI